MHIVLQDTLLTEAIPLKDDPLARVMQTIASISGQYANSIVKALVVWRTSMNPMAMMPLDLAKKKPVYVDTLIALDVLVATMIAIAI
jgi:hypothetical protein